MPITVKLRYLRIAPRKVRLVADLIRKKSVEEAQTILNFTRKRAAQPLAKLLKSGIAAAKETLGQAPGNLYISKITADQGPTLKRWRARARGRAAPIQKKASHITLTLDIHPVESGKAAALPKAKQFKGLKQEKKLAKEEKSVRAKPVFKRPEKEVRKPGFVRDLKRIFRRKAF